MCLKETQGQGAIRLTGDYLSEPSQRASGPCWFILLIVRQETKSFMCLNEHFNSETLKKIKDGKKLQWLK